jgi:hypothetical protein
MSSSISSFRTECKVLAAIALALLAVEGLMRLAQASLSVDVRHIVSAPELADGMASQPRPRVLALGNSLLREGVNAKQLEDESTSLGLTRSVSLYHPDGTSVQEWAFAFRRFFASEAHAPDCVLIFTGRTHLRDVPPRPTPLGAFYCSTRDTPRFLNRKGTNLEVASEFLLARASVAYAQRSRIQPRIFTSLIPHFQDMLRDMNVRRISPRTERQEISSYDDLALLLDSVHAIGAFALIITIPAPGSYTLAPEILETAQSHHATVIDLSQSEGLTTANFPDGWHLDAQGASVFTTRLAHALAGIPELKTLP